MLTGVRAMTTMEMKANLAELEAQRNATGRHCGSCTMCCFILGVDAPDLTKPPDSKCRHCEAGVGCIIYERRPDLCRNFYCGWLVASVFDDSWYPPISKIVINPVSNMDGSNPCWVFEVDPHRPQRWLQAPYFEKISNIKLSLRQQGASTSVRCGRHWYVMVPQAVADDPSKGDVTMGKQVVDIISGKIGPGYIMSPLGKFEWVEVSVPAELADTTWRSS
jgi:hypothetical protein